jgi:hypothetical protein
VALVRGQPGKVKGIERCIVQVIYCEDPLKANQPDEAFSAEFNAAALAGLHSGLISYEILVNDRDPVQAVCRIQNCRPEELGVYRGWMLRPEEYARLYVTLIDRGIRLINTPEQYRHCHYLPESCTIIEGFTPQSVWLEKATGFGLEGIMETLRPLGDKPVIVKDFVKSQKHYWNEACYIPSAANREAVERVVNRFLDLQGDSLNESLVFREFIEFEPVGVHSRSGMPLSRELRVFVLDGEPLFSTRYWEEGDYDDTLPAVDSFRDVMRAVRSRFFTMDVAKRLTGAWMIVELGDGQVSGLPETADVSGFYDALRARLV